MDEDYEVARTTFVTKFKTELHDRIDEYIDCLIPNIYLVQESDDWVRV
jgi:hypothetical protein